MSTFLMYRKSNYIKNRATATASSLSSYLSFEFTTLTELCDNVHDQMLKQASNTRLLSEHCKSTRLREYSRYNTESRWEKLMTVYFYLIRHLAQLGSICQCYNQNNWDHLMILKPDHFCSILTVSAQKLLLKKRWFLGPLIY